MENRWRRPSLSKNDPLISLCFVLLSLATALPSAAQECRGLPAYTIESLVARDEPECRLMQAPACQRLRPASSEAIFTGIVLHIREAEGHMLLDGKCSKTSLQVASVKVNHTFVGDVSGTVSIHAGDINGFYFNTGQRYLIVAKRLSDGTFSVTSCGGTRSLREKYPMDAKEDLAYLSSWKTLPTEASLYGRATIGREDPRLMVQKGRWLKNGPITISGKQDLTSKTDVNGSYKLDGLQAGTYTVSLDTSFYVWPAQSQIVQLVERGCAVVDFKVVTNRKPDGSFTIEQTQSKRKP